MSERPRGVAAPAKGPSQTVQWRDWSQVAFDEARESKKLVLLDLSAQWCHWCHVMDETTYSDPEVIRTINKRFVPVRVDIDKRPDISERYARGGFPTTAFLSDQGESIWGTTYVPPQDMKNVMKAILEAKEKGEVDEALERGRMQYLDLSKALEKSESLDSEFVDAIFEDIFAAYDITWGGFGIEPKFPHADAVDLLLDRYARTNDTELKSAVVSTLDHMTEGLYDEIEGGIFRYSVKRDWKLPHYEKMLDTNLGFLRNLTRARQILGQEQYERTAKGVGTYLLGRLRDPKTGAFFSSQDADEEYYKLDRDMRDGRPPPKVIEAVLSGLNCRAVTTLIEAGTILSFEEWVDAARKAWDAMLRDHWDPEAGLVRHVSVDGLYLFDDQVDFLDAAIAVAETRPWQEAEMALGIGEKVIKGVEKAFTHPDGGFGDIRKEVGAIGKLTEPERSIMANSRWARALALFGVVTHRPERIREAWAILKSFPPKRVQANGIFAAEYVRAWDVLALGPRTVEIHGIKDGPTENALWLAAKKALDPATVVLAAREQMLEIQSNRPFAVICKETGCSKEIYEPEALVSQLKAVPSGQI